MRSLKKVLRDLRAAKEMADATGTLCFVMVETGTENTIEATAIERLTKRLSEDLTRARKRLKKLAKEETAAKP
jgi:hypothetical protein